MSMFSDQVAIVTGGGRGIGAACAKALAAEGAHVVVNDIVAPSETIQAIQAAGGKASEAIADVSDAQAAADVAERTKREYGRIDLLITNAAFSDRQLFYQSDRQGFEKTINVCMWGPYNFLRAVAPIMIDQQTGGSIVCVSSPHADRAIPGAMAYNMAKAAIDQMARTAACELAEHRIRVNIVHPGWTDTPGERKFFHESELQARGSELPWGRLAHPDEIANGVIFLCNPASEYINGATLSIDGGALLPHDQMFRIKNRPSS